MTHALRAHGLPPCSFNTLAGPACCQTKQGPSRFFIAPPTLRITPAPFGLLRPLPPTPPANTRRPRPFWHCPKGSWTSKRLAFLWAATPLPNLPFLPLVVDSFPLPHQPHDQRRSATPAGRILKRPTCHWQRHTSRPLVRPDSFAPSATPPY